MLTRENHCIRAHWGMETRTVFRQRASEKALLKIMAWSKTSRSSIAALIAATTLLSSSTAHAEPGREKAKAPAKGTVGMAFLGAELVVTVEALVGVEPWWGYAIGGGLGAIAGGVGGYFIDKMDKPAVSMGLLAGGMVLAVPTTIAVLSATAYKPPKNPEIDSQGAKVDLPQLQAIAARHPLSHRAVSPGLLNLNPRGEVSLRMPELDIRSAYTSREIDMMRLAHLQNVQSTPSFRSVMLNLNF